MAVAIVEAADAKWIVQPDGDRKPVILCPCCDRPFLSRRAAMLVAEALYPNDQITELPAPP